MGYKTLLVHLDNGAKSAERLELAFRLAERFGSHLVALFALSTAWSDYAIAGESADALELEMRSRKESAERAERVFRSAASRHAEVASEWRSSELDAGEELRLSARYADLVLVGQRERGVSSGLAPDFVETLALGAGRPLLVVPYAGKFAEVGRRVLVAWNGSREAARALTDALPLLAQAQAVDVCAFEPQSGDHGEVPGADIALWLARHGVKASASHQRAPGVEVGMQILSRAADQQADLIVMGAYGHSRLRELVLGGATRTLLDSMTVPVLMSH